MGGVADARADAHFESPGQFLLSHCGCSRAPCHRRADGLGLGLAANGVWSTRVQRVLGRTDILVFCGAAVAGHLRASVFLKPLSKAALLAAVGLPASALACAVCGAGDEPSRSSYVVMSVIISLLPLLMLGGIVGFVVYRSRDVKGRASSDERA